MADKNYCLLLVGCGYLGRAVARLAAGRYQRVEAYVSNPTPRPELEQLGAIIHPGDVFDDSKLPAGVSGDDKKWVKHALVMLPPSTMPSAEGSIEKLSNKIEAADCARSVLISSTGVYAGSATEAVTAESNSFGHSKRSIRLRQIETEWLAAADTNSILRLAGIYGPGRVIGLQNLKAGQSVGGSPDAWLNLIHVEDAAELSLRCLRSSLARVELGADGEPVKRGEYYQYVAASKNLPEPLFEGALTRNTQSKRCDPGSSFQRLLFQPRFPNYRAGVDDALVNGG